MKRKPRTEKNPYQGGFLKKPSTTPPKEILLLVLLPTEISWHAPVLLRDWGYNDVPDPETHLAVLKYWNEVYEAELRRMGSNIVELAINRPVQEWEQALELAKEQYDYCDNSWRPAAKLIGATSWYFWWD